MKLRGLIHRKITGSKGPTKAQQAIYDKAYKSERSRIARERTAARTIKIKAMAKQDATRASTGKGSRVMGSLVTAGRSIGKRIEKMPTAEEYAKRQKKMFGK